MSAQFKLDGSTVNQDPINAPIAIRETLGYDHAGAPIFAPFYKTVLEFNAMVSANYAQWAAVCDGAAHSIYMPSIGAPASFATYTGVFLVMTGGNFSTGIYAYGVQIEVRHIS